MVDHFVFDLLLSLGDFLTHDVFLNGKLHPLRQLLLRLLRTHIVPRRLWLLTQSGWVDKPGLVFFREAPAHGDLLAGVADLRFESALIFVFLEILAVLIVVLPIEHLVPTNLVYMLHSLAHLWISKLSPSL